MILEARDVSIRFGGIVALDGFSMDVPSGAIVGLMGPNGAGKSTFFNCVGRLYQPDGGRILYGGNDLLARRRHELAGIGIGRTFQHPALFNSLTVRQNIDIGSDCGAGTLSRLLPRRGGDPEERVAQIVRLLELEDHLDVLAGNLPFVLQKRTELARSLAARCTLLLLDEPAAGLNRRELAELAEAIRRFHLALGLTIVLVEHNFQFLSSLCDKVVVLNFGRKLAEGTPAEMRTDPEVIAAYLGSRR